jgi:DNA-binding FrmR family transcriptional regulator
MKSTVSPAAGPATRTTGCPAERAAIVVHARRAAGQTGALAEMIADGRSFAEVAQQLLAARGSLDALLIRLVGLELDACLTDRSQRVDIEALLRAALGSGLRIRPTREGATGSPPTRSPRT